MRVLYINEHFNCTDGSSVHGRKLIEALEFLGVEIITFPSVISDKRLAYKKSFIQSIEEKLPSLFAETLIFVKKNIKRIKIIILVSKIIRDKNPDCILIRLGIYDISPVLIKIIFRKKVVLEVNCPHYLERKVYYKMKGKLVLIPSVFYWIEKINWKSVDAIYVISNKLKEIIRREIKPNTVLMQVIPNGIDKNNLIQAVSLEIIHRNSAVKICFVGSFHPWHGVNLLLSAFEKILTERSNVELVLIGDGEEKSFLVDRVNASQFLKGKVFFWGKLEHEVTLLKLREMDILVAPYPFMDNFYFSPLKLFEYMGVGRAIIASKIGQISEILSDGEDALLVPPSDVSAFVDACLRLIDSAELRQKLGSKVLITARDYTWDKSAEKLILLIKSALSLGKNEK